MKGLIKIIVLAGILAGFGGMVQFRSAAETVHRVPNITSYDIKCLVENYKPKTGPELLAMSPRELIDELIKVNPASFDSYKAMADYEDSIYGLVRKAGTRGLPVISEYIDLYDQKNRAYCTGLRFGIVSKLASDIDRFDFRLRATKEGRVVIDSLEAALHQIVTAVPGLTFINGAQSIHRPAEFTFLKELKGINGADRHVADTLWVRYKVPLSDGELVEFTSYLIAKDPTYPAWSKSELIKDYSRINEAGNPSQVYVYNNAKRFYDACREFKRSKKNLIQPIPPPTKP